MKRLCMGCMEEYDSKFEVCPCCGYVEGTAALEAYHISPGSVLAGRYLVGRVLGFGGFGITYIGFDYVLQQKVAVKEYLPSEFATRMPLQQEITVYSGEREEQFRAGLAKIIDEAKRLAQFKQEPGVVHVFDCFEENNTAYIIMEYLDGESLKAKLEREGKMGVEEAKPIILAILSALKKVHAVGIIHRDIAPDNIYILKNEEVKLLDFGAARYATTQHSKSLSVIIKPGYAPEEQYRSRSDQGPWTDIYALAATFYKMLTGITPEDAMERSVKDQVAEPSKLGVVIDKSLENSIMNAMNVKIEGRTQSAEAFEADILADDVKKIIVKNKKADIGKWPLWVKAAAVSGIVLVAAAGIILSGLKVGPLQGLTKEEGKALVPNVVNMETELATQKCSEAQLKLQINDKTYSNEIKQGFILTQSIPDGSYVDLNSYLDVCISAGVKPTYVPGLVGLTKEEAEKQIEAAELKAEYQEAEGKAAPGTIASQDAEANQPVDTGTIIHLTVSKGKPGGDPSIQVTVPNITGINYDQAGDQLITNFIYLSKTEEVFDDQIPAGCIISQDTAEGTAVYQNTVVKVSVSKGKETVRVPDTEYKSEAEAKQLLLDNSLTAEVEYEAKAGVASGSVFRQSIAAGSMVDKGSTVTITVSTGEPVSRQPETQPQTQGTPRQTQPATQAPTQPAQTAPPPVETEAPRQTEAAEERDNEAHEAGSFEMSPGGDTKDINDRLNNHGI